VIEPLTLDMLLIKQSLLTSCTSTTSR